MYITAQFGSVELLLTNSKDFERARAGMRSLTKVPIGNGQATVMGRLDVSYFYTK